MSTHGKSNGLRLTTDNMKKQNIHRLILTALAIMCYANTLTLHYALDDRMVILESKYTIKGGWDSVKAIFTEDTFSGYFGADKSIVTGGRYRPMSQLSYMIEFQLFGKDIRERIGDLDDFYNLHNAEHEAYFYDTPLPFVNHLMNLIFYLLLCLLIYEVLARIFPQSDDAKWYQSLAFLATLLFAVHPIHTEVVANVKGRDEIFAMLGAFASLWCSLKYLDSRRWYWLVGSLLAFTFGIFSKENVITFLAVVPLAVFYCNYSGKRAADYFITLIPLVFGSVFFVWVRYKVLGSMMPPDTTSNILNNPYINATRAQQVATVLVTWGIYLKLLVFPHPLTHDYYPHQIAITDFSNPLVWLILTGCLLLVGYGVWKLRQKTVPAFGILYFIITFSITSNLLFNVGTFMNERFVFMPSIGFTLLVGWWIYRLCTSQKTVLRNTAIGVTAILCGNDLIARGVLACVQEAGFSVPGDISVVGFDDLPLAASLTPPLTTVRQSLADIGWTAGYVLHAMMNNIPISRTMLRPELIIRKSTAIAKPRLAIRHLDEKDSVVKVNPQLYSQFLQHRLL